MAPLPPFTARRLLPPLLLAAAVLAAAPFLGLVRDALLGGFPAGAPRAITLALAAAGGAAFLAALARLPRPRGPRLAGLAACVGLVAAQVVGFATGNVQVDVVERVHVVEYGLLAVAFYHAFRPLGALAAPLLSLLAGGLVGTGDEWVQWLVPTRVGEAGDVWLNLAATGTGVLFALCAFPAPPGGWRLSPGLRRAAAGLAAVAIVTFGGLYHAAHLGYSIHDPAAAATFRSWYSAERLPQVAAERERRWRTRPPTLHPLSREDRYFTEATWRVAHRNGAMQRGELPAAWREQLILERHYAPVLRRRGLASGEPLDLAPWDRERLRDQARGREAVPYLSPVLAHRIALRPSKPQWWTGVALLAAASLAAGAWPARRAATTPPAGERARPPAAG